MVAKPEIIDEVVGTFARAAQLNREDPLRRGNVIEITAEAADELMITADLHGNRRNYNRILEIADLDGHRRRHLVMQEVCHGGPMYPSGYGDMSHTMLEDMAQLKIDHGERFHFLLSNHELAELTDFPIMKSKRMLNLLFRCGLQEMYGEAADRVREAAMGFIRSLPLGLRLPGGVFVCHSLPADTDTQGFDREVFDRQVSEKDLAEGGDVFRLTWGRDYRQENADAFAQIIGANVIVTGHEPCAAGYRAPNSRQVIIDCCNDPACYLLLPVSGEPLSHGAILRRVHPLHNSKAAP